MGLKISHVLNDQLLRHKYLAAIVVLLVGSFLATCNLFFNKTLPVGHDILFHVFQADQFYRVLESGVILPHWALNYSHGYGSPNFIFYAPLSYYTVAAVHAVGLSLINSIKIFIWLSFFLSGVTMFSALNRISRYPDSLLCAVLYQILPFHLADLYCRGTLAELMAYIWFPLIVMYLHGLFQSKGCTLAGIGLTVSYAGLIITHLVSGFIFTWVIAAYVLFSYLRLKDNWLAIRAIFFMALGLGLSTFYLLPVIFERQFVQLGYVTMYSFKDYFLFMPRMLLPDSNKFLRQLNVMVILEVMLYVALLARIAKKKSWQSKPSPQGFFLYLFPVVVILMTSLATPLWEVLPGFASLQFPWRWISVLEVALCFLLTSAFSEVWPGVTWGKFSDRILAYLIGIVFVVACLFVATTDEFYPQDTIDGITNPLQAEANNDLRMEYTPVTVTALDELFASGGSEKVSIVSGMATPRIVEWQPERRKIDIHASAWSKIRVALFYYPGWKAVLDGRVIPITVQKGSGAILIDIPAGDHSVILSFTDTPLRLVSKYVSLVSFIIVIAGLVILQREYCEYRKRSDV